MSDIIIEAENLISRRGAFRLDIPRVRIFSGETLALIGPNGSGKTTFLHALSFLKKPESGRIFFRGFEVGTRSDAFHARRRCAMVFQDPLLFCGTVEDNVSSGLRIRGIPRAEIKKTAGELMERFNLSRLASRPSRELSGGEARRTSLARAFATSPEIIFLDEPFSSLDASSRNGLISLFKMNMREAGISAVIVSHDREEILELADRTAVLEDGRLTDMGTTETVLNNPVDEYVASFSGMDAVYSGKVIRGTGGSITVRVNGIEVEAVSDAAVGEDVVICLRPENVIVSTVRQKKGSSVRNSLDGSITDIIQTGPYYRIRMDCGIRLQSFVTPVSVARLRLSVGKRITSSFKATSVHVIRKGRRYPV
ncbi:MAG: ABC transporter ATP-binding protein [Spirochaetes bacterium]|jgi:tungstate transport system ATP-binding protein|nr:ABC transporter ATP-binding protein [Spirochaetota bacterium]